MTTAEARLDSMEAMRAYRPIRNYDWISDIRHAAYHRLGAGALNFRDESLGPRRIKLLGTGELVRVNGPENLLGHLSSARLVELAGKRMIHTFAKRLRPEPTGQLKVIKCNEEEGLQQVLVADIRHRRVLPAERSVLEQVVEEEAGRELSWPVKPRFSIKLATVADGVDLGGDDLDVLARYLPNDIDARGGQIEPVTLELRGPARTVSEAL
ncbi:MAG TPA: hypothetical protein VFX86_01360 [Candidatus Saccharimonadales bacterium]|nr:hypothetical protein [Candidatus Saccharimonadales bacterium]